jgi:OFA family oxalate/formate antiporter-like MFS transporter
VAAAQFLRPAPADYAPPGWTPTAQQRSIPATELTLSAALRTPHWYLLWSMLALNVTAGAALISVAAPLAQELTQVGPALGAIAVCLISLFNGAGRLFWGTMSDRIGRSRAFMKCSCCRRSPSRAAGTTSSGCFVPVALIALYMAAGSARCRPSPPRVGAKNAGTSTARCSRPGRCVVGPLLIAAVRTAPRCRSSSACSRCRHILPVVFNAFAQRGAVRTTVRSAAARRGALAVAPGAPPPWVASGPARRAAPRIAT